MAIEDRTNTTEIDKNLVPPENQDTKPVNTAPQSGDSYEVRINSYKVVSALGITAVHNEIAFYRNGEALVAFNGNAHDRQSGHSQAFTISQGNTLKVSAMDKTFESIGMERVASASFGKIDRETFVEKLKAVTQASQWINKNDVEYVVIGGLGFEAQNSNSVASSLTQAMGYEYPKKELNVWAPGCDRTLLPDDWEPYQKNYDLLKSINDVTPNEVVAKTRDEKKVKPESTSDNTLADRLFNPNTSTVPYKKRDQEEPDPPMPEPTPEESPQTVDKSPENEDEEASDDTSPEDPDNNEESVETLKTNVGFTSSTGQSIAAGTNLTASFKMASTGIPLETIEPPRENLDQNQAVALTNKGTAQINYAPQQALI